QPLLGSPLPGWADPGALVRRGRTPTPAVRRGPDTVPPMTRYGGHVVPTEQQDATAATLPATANLPCRPSDAERSRALLATRACGSLATISNECPGYPFASLVGYAVDDRGRPLFCLSGLAEHSRNIAADPRASLMITEGGGEDLLATGR